MARLIDFTDAELAGALHMLEGNEDGFEGAEKRAWLRIKGLVLSVAAQNRATDRELMSERRAKFGDEW